MTTCEAVLLILVTVGASTDVFTGKIPNILTYPACVFGLVWGLAESGGVGLLGSVWGLLLGFVPFFLLFLAGGLGGGDVKMMAAVGAVMGFEFTLTAMINSIFVGALIALLIVIWHGRGLAALHYLGCVCLRWFLPGATRPKLEVGAQVPFGVAICFASFMGLVASWQQVASPWHLILGLLPGSI